MSKPNPPPQKGKNISKSPSKTLSKTNNKQDGHQSKKASRVASPAPSPKGSAQRLLHKRFSEASAGPGLMELVGGENEEDDHDKLGGRSSSIIKFYPDWCKNCNCLSSRPLSENATALEQLKAFFSCPPQGTLARIIIMLLLIILLWGFLYCLFIPMTEEKDEHGEMEPNHGKNPAWINGPIFGLGVILISGLVTGVLIKRFLNLPTLLASLIIGIVLNNCQPINVFRLLIPQNIRDCGAGCKRDAIHSQNIWVKPIRLIALAIILTRAGIELSPKQLKKLKGIVPALAFGPCIVEAMACATLTYVFFNVLIDNEAEKMNIAMCFVGGFALAAVSPAVVVPGALSLKKSGYGVVKGVPTLLIAASSIDDVLAISAYSISLGFAIKDKKRELWQVYSGGILGIVVGFLHGTIIGILLHFIPPRTTKNKALHRMFLLLLMNFCSVMGYEDQFFSSAGSISVLVTSFIAGFGWRSQPHWKRPMKKIEKWLAMIWILWVPLLFGTIGKEINFDGPGFKPPNVQKIFGIIGISLVFRLTTAFLIAYFGTSFNVKESLFVAFSWIPKATVQAALAPLVLTIADEASIEDERKKEILQGHAKIVVNVAILAVLITAPLGSVMIALTGPKLLQLNNEAEITQEVEIEFPQGEGIDPAESTYELMEEEKRRTINLLENQPAGDTAAASLTAPRSIWTMKLDDNDK